MAAGKDKDARQPDFGGQHDQLTAICLELAAGRISAFRQFDRRSIKNGFNIT